jgi:hypothetical protein
MNGTFGSNILGKGLSIDWIHNLVYYNEDKKIIVFNMTHTRYGFVVIEEEENYITDLSVNPLDSVIFYCSRGSIPVFGKKMKALQDGSNQTVLRDKNIRGPGVLTIDLVSRKIIWYDFILQTLSSIDFEGNNYKSFYAPKTARNTNHFFDNFQTFVDEIYWSDSEKKSIFKTKLGLNSAQTNHLITLENNAIQSFKIIDSSLQPNSTNRCINANCSHLCIPISIDQYRCVCPQFIRQNDNESVSFFVQQILK